MKFTTFCHFRLEYTIISTDLYFETMSQLEQTNYYEKSSVVLFNKLFLFVRFWQEPMRRSMQLHYISVTAFS